MARSVSTPDGTEWMVRRRWVSWQPRWRRFWRRKRRDAAEESGGGYWFDAIDIPFFDDFGWAILAILGLVAVVFFVIPALIFVVELLLFFVLLAVIGFLRLVLRRPWVVEATPADSAEPGMQWAVVGWRQSGRVIDDVVESLSLGHSSLHPEGAEPIEPVRQACRYGGVSVLSIRPEPQP